MCTCNGEGKKGGYHCTQKKFRMHKNVQSMDDTHDQRSIIQATPFHTSGIITIICQDIFPSNQENIKENITFCFNVFCCWCDN